MEKQQENGLCITRRGFVRAGMVVGIAALVGSAAEMVAPEVAYASGGASSSGGGVMDGRGFERAYFWFDRGGFAATGGSPAQGWDDASAEYFANRMIAYVGQGMNSITGALGNTHDVYMQTARAAMDLARGRAKYGHARVVAVGWGFQRNRANFNFAYDKNSNFDMMIPRPATEEECPASAGWDTISEVGGETWRNYAWNQGRRDNPGSSYNLVVIAVADVEPESNIDVPLTKTWLADSGYLANRPAEVRFQLICDADGTVYETVLRASEGWTGKFTGVAPNKAYRLWEVPVPGYGASGAQVDGSNLAAGFTCENTLKTTERSVRKVWAGDERALEYRPDELEVTLVGSDGRRYPATLSEANGWKHTWTGLIKTLSDGTEVAYTVEEESVPHYTARIEAEGDTGFVIENTLPPEPVKVKKSAMRPSWI